MSLVVPVGRRGRRVRVSRLDRWLGECGASRLPRGSRGRPGSCGTRTGPGRTMPEIARSSRARLSPGGIPSGGGRRRGGLAGDRRRARIADACVQRSDVRRRGGAGKGEDDDTGAQEPRGAREPVESRSMRCRGETAAAGGAMAAHLLTLEWSETGIHLRDAVDGISKAGRRGRQVRVPIARTWTRHGRL